MRSLAIILLLATPALAGDPPPCDPDAVSEITKAATGYCYSEERHVEHIQLLNEVVDLREAARDIDASLARRDEERRLALQTLREESADARKRLLDACDEDIRAMKHGQRQAVLRGVVTGVAVVGLFGAGVVVGRQ